MHHVAAVICACLIAVPAFAKPARVSTAPSLSKPTATAQAKHRSRIPRRGNALGGIHPLVGSGEY